MLVHYLDGDLGQYHEFGTAVMVNPPGSMRAGRVRCGRPPLSSITFPSTRIHSGSGPDHLGLPKVMADFTVRDDRRFGFDLSIDGQLVVGMDLRPVPIPSRPCSPRASRRSAPTRIGRRHP